MKLNLKLFKTCLIFFVITIAIYGIVAVTLILAGKTHKPAEHNSSLSFKELICDYSLLPELTPYHTRDNRILQYRYYPSRSDTALILLHGSGWHSRYFLPLAKYISSSNLAQVYTPDLRGHGPSPYKRGDIDYMGQFEDDIEDLIAVIRKNPTVKTIILGGHSSGGGLAVRFAGSSYGKDISAYILLAPYLAYNAPTTRENSGGWANPNTPRIIGLSMLNSISITALNRLPVISFNIPAEVRDGSETLEYSYRLLKSYEPRDYQKDLKSIHQPLLVIAGTQDESFVSSQYQPVISKLTDVEVRELTGASHMGVVVGPEVRGVLKKWLLSLNSSSKQP